jgi:transposase
MATHPERVDQLLHPRGATPAGAAGGLGQGHDAPMCLPLLAALRVPRAAAGRPRTRPAEVIADKAYSSQAIRAELRRGGITSCNPEPRNQQAHRRRRGSRGGRPVSYDAKTYTGRNVVEQAFNTRKQWRGLATRYDRYALVHCGGVVLAGTLARPRSQETRSGPVALPAEPETVRLHLVDHAGRLTVWNVA